MRHQTNPECTSPAVLSRVEVDEDGREHHLAASARTMAQLERILDPDRGPYSDWKERAAICILTESTGRNRTTLLIHEVIQPEEGDLTAPSEGDRHDLEFNPDYRERARAAARAVTGNAGLLYVHTHPEWTGGRFSPGDLEHDQAQLYQDAKHLGDDVPLAAAVVHDGSDPWRIWRYQFKTPRTSAQRDREEFGISSMERTPITAVRVVDVSLDKRPTGNGIGLLGPRTHRGRLNEDQQTSTITLWEQEGQQRLAGLRVGVVGCGGGGSILAEVLPRLGIGELVLVDFDRLKPRNQNRHLGATEGNVEANRSKVDVSAEIARLAATCPDFEVKAVVGSAFENEAEWDEYDSLDALLDCDVIINAADPDTVRCTVGRLAYAHLIPVIDAGSKLRTDQRGNLTDKSRSTVAVASPGNPCLKCSGQWSDPGFEQDLIGEDPQARYGDDGGDKGIEDKEEAGEVREPSAMPTNLLTMGLACQRFLHVVHGLSPEIAVGAAILRLHNWTFQWEQYGRGKVYSCRQNCIRPAVGTGDNASLKRGPDQNLREELWGG